MLARGFEIPQPIMNDYINNCNRDSELPNHEKLYKPVSPYIRRKYNNFVNFLIALAKNTSDDDKTYLQEIIKKTSDAEEQYALFCIYWYAKGYKPYKRNYRKLTEEEKEYIRKNFAVKSEYSLAKELGRPVSTIHYFLKRENLL